ncbi:hypothetical protein BP5796_00747 [Coleophoma crateriformis]|uniref:Uncharacterized protein n=1 Tax=Coleophoma crateriformis TaxID=565419 RepID=A0A3D8T8Y6_9HELO|nr:hypothetical protein BP5796_00747 [Coleophoma crateriformis]
MTCSKGHVHPPWVTTGVLKISKCESICGFCQKETKTAANLRKHVAIHIKNEGLNLTIAEGSSGRGRLEMPPTVIPQEATSSRSSSTTENSPILAHRLPLTHRTAQGQPQGYQNWSDRSVDEISSVAMSPQSQLVRSVTSPNSNHLGAVAYQNSNSMPQDSAHPFFNMSNPSQDPFRALRDRNLHTKHAWTVIPAAEGFRILDLCKTLSVVRDNDHPSSVPCYNRETIFDEEWQAHIKDVHGVFLLWPETWMRRVEVLDLEPFSGDIGACNEFLLDGR